ncbi:hypothetical protein HOG21_01825 [bacterium]|nr:hypothetical protein [bacterium]
MLFMSSFFNPKLFLKTSSILGFATIFHFSSFSTHIVALNSLRTQLFLA